MTIDTRRIDVITDIIGIKVLLGMGLGVHVNIFIIALLSVLLIVKSYILYKTIRMLIRMYYDTRQQPDTGIR